MNGQIVSLVSGKKLFFNNTLLLVSKYERVTGAN